MGLGCQLVVRQGSRIFCAEGRLRTCVKVSCMGKWPCYSDSLSGGDACLTGMVFTGILTVSIYKNCWFNRLKKFQLILDR